MKRSDIGDIFKGILGKPTKRAEREKKIIKLAQKRGGQLSVLDIVAESLMDTTEVDEILADMTTKGYVQMDITEEGAIIYVFPGVAERFELEKQEQFRREITGEKTIPSPESKLPPFQKSRTQSATKHSPSPPLFSEKKRKSEELDFPLPPPKPTLKQTVETNNLTFELCGYERAGKNIICHCQIKSNKHNKNLGIRPGAEMYDESAQKYPARVQVVSGNVRDSIDYLWLSLKANTPLKISISAKIPLWQVKMIAILEFYCKDDILGPIFKVQFCDISLH